MRTVSPEVPYKVNIGRLLGQRITIEGCVDPSAESFDINLYANADIAFHLNPRFTSDYTSPVLIVRCTRIDDVWVPPQESRCSDQHLFQRGREYKVEIVCEQERFMIYVDGKFLDYYIHRVPLSCITHLEIVRHTKISMVQISDDKDSSEIDKFCKMLSEKLKRLPTQSVIEAQNAFMMKLLEMETSIPAS